MMKRIFLLMVIALVLVVLLTTTATTAFNSPIPTEAGCYPGPYCGPRWTDTPAPTATAIPTATFVPSPLEPLTPGHTAPPTPEYSDENARVVPAPALLPISGGGDD